MRARPWSWLMALIGGCMSARSRTSWERLGSDEQRKVREMMGNGGQPLPWC